MLLEIEPRTRVSIYRRLGSAIGNTPLAELTKLSVPNGNRIFAKLEYQNPGGSHYDRVYLCLIKSFEKAGVIKPGITSLIETTSGNAGASFAWVGTQLGYKCIVVMPEDVAESRKRQILGKGAHLILSPAGEYVQGAIRTLRRYLEDHRDDYRAGRLYCLNHSQEPLSTKAVSPIAGEIYSTLAARSLTTDHLILACGNGTTIIGVGGRIKRLQNSARVIVFDPFEAPVAFERKYPGRYKKDFGVEPSDLTRHRILGTGVWGVTFPHVMSDEFLKIVDEVRLVRDEEMSGVQGLLAERENLYPGRSSAAALSVVLKLTQTVSKKNFVVIFYDELNYYPEPSEFRQEKMSAARAV